jgi:hypothetical protein
MGALWGRMGTRFLVVTVLPNVLLFGYIGFLLAAGTPTRSPSVSRALTAIEHLDANQITALVFGLLIFSVATHPLQVPLVQLLEGYWWGLPFGPRLAQWATNRFRKEWNEARETLKKTRNARHWDWKARNSRRYAQFRSSWLPRGEDQLLPTELGNTLWRGETQAGDRYRLELDVVLPRLTPLMEPGVLGNLSDLRNQLDAAVRLCVAAGVATAVSVGLLLWQGPWLFLALAMYALSWACYRSAVAAARRFSLGLAAAIDLYHLKLYDALSLKRPADLKQERRRNALLSKLFSGELGENEMAEFSYFPPKIDAPAADQGSPGTTAPPGLR